MGRTARSSPSPSPSFFKILIPNNYSSQLRLPTDFVKQHKRILHKQHVMLKIGSSGRTWTVRVEQMDVDDYYFTRGWAKFTSDLELEMFDLLLFTFIGRSSFEVCVYGKNACRKELQPVESSDDDDMDEAVGLGNDDDPQRECIKQKSRGSIKRKRSKACFTEEEGDPLYFEVRLKLHQKSRVYIPKKFIVAAKLSRAINVTLEYFPGDYRQKVELDRRMGRSQMSKGWSKFRRTNGLEFGKWYSFEFKPRKKVILVKELKKQKTSLRSKPLVKSFDENVELSKDIDDDYKRLNQNTRGLNNDNLSGCKVKIEDTVSDDEARPDSTTNPCFQIVLLKHRQSRMCVPKFFAEATGLITKKKVALEYYPRGQRVNVALDLRTSHNFQLDLTRGWPEFRKANKLVFGKNYFLEFIPGKQVIQVSSRSRDRSS